LQDNLKPLLGTPELVINCSSSVQLQLFEKFFTVVRHGFMDGKAKYTHPLIVPYKSVVAIRAKIEPQKMLQTESLDFVISTVWENDAHKKGWWESLKDFKHSLNFSTQDYESFKVLLSKIG
jgi:hypothetical protein